MKNRKAKNESPKNILRSVALPAELWERLRQRKAETGIPAKRTVADALEAFLK